MNTQIENFQEVHTQQTERPTLANAIEISRKAGQERRLAMTEGIRSCWQKIKDATSAVGEKIAKGTDVALGLTNEGARAELKAAIEVKAQDAKREAQLKAVAILEASRAKIENSTIAASNKASELATATRDKVLTPTVDASKIIAQNTTDAAIKGVLFTGAAVATPVVIAGIGAIKAGEYVVQQGKSAAETVARNISERTDAARSWGQKVVDQAATAVQNGVDEMNARRQGFMAKLFEIRAIPGRKKGEVLEKVSNAFDSIANWASSKKQATENAKMEAYHASANSQKIADDYRSFASELRSAVTKRNSRLVEKYTALSNEGSADVAAATEESSAQQTNT